MRFIELILFNKPSGGNIQLKALTNKLSAGEKIIEIKLFNNKRINIIGICHLLYRIIFLIFTKGSTIIYTDPILSFLEVIPKSGNIIRFVQSVDELVYKDNPKLNKFSQNFISKYIKFMTKTGKNKIYVCSYVCKQYIEKYSRIYFFTKPTLNLIKVDQKLSRQKKSNQIISIMSNPYLKGIEILKRIALDFDNYEFLIITSKVFDIKSSKNIKIKSPKNRFEIFEELSNSICHISCSSKESLGLPVYEAMAMRIPSVFMINSSNEYLQKYNLLFFKSYQRKKFKDIFKKCICNKEKELILNLQDKLVREKFDFSYLNN